MRRRRRHGPRRGRLNSTLWHRTRRTAARRRARRPGQAPVTTTTGQAGTSLPPSILRRDNAQIVNFGWELHHLHSLDGVRANHVLAARAPGCHVCPTGACWELEDRPSSSLAFTTLTTPARPTTTSRKIGLSDVDNLMTKRAAAAPDPPLARCVGRHRLGTGRDTSVVFVV